MGSPPHRGRRPPLEAPSYSPLRPPLPEMPLARRGARVWRPPRLLPPAGVGHPSQDAARPAPIPGSVCQCHLCPTLPPHPWGWGSPLQEWARALTRLLPRPAPPTGAATRPVPTPGMPCRERRFPIPHPRLEAARGALPGCRRPPEARPLQAGFPRALSASGRPHPRRAPQASEMRATTMRHRHCKRGCRRDWAPGNWGNAGYLRSPPGSVRKPGRTELLPGWLPHTSHNRSFGPAPANGLSVPHKGDLFPTGPSSQWPRLPAPLPR